ncbi:hypothetical protein FKM82_012323 [Ascaphus truei]
MLPDAQPRPQEQYFQESPPHHPRDSWENWTLRTRSHRSPWSRELHHKTKAAGHIVLSKCPASCYGVFGSLLLFHDAFGDVLL